MMIQGNGHHVCEYEAHQIEALVAATQQNGEHVDRLCKTMEIVSLQYREISRWLLIVVCTIALGSKALEMAQSIWGKTPISVAEAQYK